MKNNFI